MDFELQSTIIKEAIVYDEVLVGGRIPVIIRDHESDPEQEVHERHYVYVVTPPGMSSTIPKAGTKGIVMFPSQSVENDIVGYWMGRIYDKFDENDRVTPTQYPKLENKSGTALIGVGEGEAKMSHKESSVSAKLKSSEMSYKYNKFTISGGGADLNIIDENGIQEAFLRLSKKKSELGSIGKMYISSGGDMIFRNNAQTNFIITGSKLEDDLIGDKIGNDAYKNIDTFYLKSKKTIIKGGNGPILMSSGNMSIKLVGGLVGGGGGIPGTGPLNTFSLQAASGNMEVFAGGGTITIQSFNPTMTSSVDIICGSLLKPLSSFMKLTSTSAILTHEISPLVGASVELSMGNADMYALKNVNLDALTGSMTLTSTTGTTISTLTKIVLDALTTIDIKALIKTTIETQILDLSKSTMIKAGPKTVIPTGSGPFCALPTCLFTGAPQAGSVATT